MKRTSLLTALLLILAMLASGCGGSGSDNKAKDTQKRLVYGAEFEYEKLNPLLDTTNVDNMIFSGLTRFDQNNQAVPDLAESWTISDDQLVYTFKLRKDVKWHDGTTFSSSDVKFTLDKVLDPAVNTPIRQEFEQIAAVEAPDAGTVIIKLKQTFPPLLDKLSLGILPEHMLKGKDLNNADFNSNPVGTGPFKFKQWKKGESRTVTANESFYRGKPKLDEVVFKFLPDANVRLVQMETGEVDLVFVEPEQLDRVSKIAGAQVYEVPSADYRCMMYNFNDPLWQDVRIRQALNYSVDRTGIVSAILRGKGQEAYGPLQKSWANNPDVEKYAYNPDQAKALLAEAGWKAGADGILEKDGKKLSFVLTCPLTDPVRVAIANTLATDFKKIGVEAEPDPKDWSVIEIEKCQAFVLGWGSPFDPDDHTFKLFTSGVIGTEDNNLGSYRNAEVDRLLQAARTTSDQSVRKQYYTDFQKTLNADPAYNFICYLDAIYAVNKNVSGIKPRLLGHHGAGFLWNIEEWDKK